ncbi:PREDICTED: LOW QUALITY PROTEIN: high mobility group B protein 6 [Camelina sativa]|uniref:LOW QUALITY PROTEIN: high mobility group B protein 6 n=1 Tax=Camelina sativa TaxID=90675 RepID=A0ABM0UZQ1_CAMSA|nr:PREDICTED: LOW QUALITY PROTEIN: high mobility group B protein 6 [Camelina sativa]
MASTADPAPTKKPRNSRKALKQKNEIVETPPAPVSAKGKPAKSFEQELMEMQAMMEKMKIEKDKTEELLKEKDEILRKKEEELETRDAEQEKLKLELKKLQKMKEFKPNMTFACGQTSLTQAEQEKANKKKKKDCPETKRPSSSYVLWCKEQWAEIKKEHPEADFKETSNIIGAKWKSLSAEDKKPYEERYLVEKEAYLQVVAKEKREKEAMKLLVDDQKQKNAMELLDQYLNFVQEAEQDNKKKNKKEKDPRKPKHPVSAFLAYANERRAALREENKSVVEVAKITGEEWKWKNLSDKKKAPFEEVAKRNKETYLQEMEVYKRTKEEEALSQKKEEEELLKLHKQEALQLLKKKEKTDNLIKKEKETKKKKNENVDPNKPKKPASSYFLFSKDERKKLTEERPGTSNSTITALISVKWKELSEEEKQVYNGKAAKLMEAYKKELEAYNKSAAATTSS